jgi:hypothetical protein
MAPITAINSVFSFLLFPGFVLFVFGFFVGWVKFSARCFLSNLLERFLLSGTAWLPVRGDGRRLYGFSQKSKHKIQNFRHPEGCGAAFSGESGL